MQDKRIVWVDTARCSGCGACIEVCSAGAISLTDSSAHGLARIDEARCTGCEICLDACPTDALQPMDTVQGEIVHVKECPLPIPHQASPLAQMGGTAVAVAGTGLVMKAAGAVVHGIGRWLARGLTTSRRSAAQPSVAGRTGAGRRARHRWRGD